jgi:hypothetical protein
VSDLVKFILASIGFLFAGLLGLVFFGALWLRVGFAVAFFFLAAVLLFFGWRMDKRDRAAREG